MMHLSIKIIGADVPKINFESVPNKKSHSTLENSVGQVVSIGDSPSYDLVDPYERLVFKYLR